MRKVLRTILWRAIAGLGVLWGAATLCFITINVTGGDPALALVGGPDAMPTAAVLERVRAEYGLDKPLYEQYFHYLGKLAQGDLGESYRLKISVAQAIAEQIGPTVELTLSAAVLGVVLAIVIATFSARRAPWIVKAFSGTELVLASVPPFVLGMALLLAFSFSIHWFPAVGNTGWGAIVLPTLTMAVPCTVNLTQVLRQDLEDILEQPFITTARARGLSDIGVRFFHALRHGLIPILAWSGVVFAYMFGNAVIIETLFSRQGVGRLMFDAATNKDIPVVLGITLLAAAIYVSVNLMVDLLNALIDPRVRTA